MIIRAERQSWDVLFNYFFLRNALREDVGLFSGVPGQLLERYSSFKRFKTGWFPGSWAFCVDDDMCHQFYHQPAATFFLALTWINLSRYSFAL
jgi:hypothetical protein